MQNIEKVNHDSSIIIPPPMYPLKVYKLLYPRQEHVYNGEKVYEFLDGHKTKNPAAYVKYLEYKRYNPNSNIDESEAAAFLHASLTTFQLYDGIQLENKDPHYARNNLYIQMRNLIEQLDMDSVSGLMKFPKFERSGLAKDIREGYVKLISTLNQGEMVPSLRKTCLKEFHFILQNLMCYYNFSYNRGYVSFHIVMRWTKQLTDISHLHDRYTRIALNKMEGNSNNYT